MRKHADFHLISNEELSGTAKMLEEMVRKMIVPFEKNMEAVKEQIIKLNHTTDDATMQFITNLIQRSEVFLSGAQERLQKVQQVNEDWTVAEEVAKIQDMVNRDSKKHTVTVVNLEEGTIKSKEIIHPNSNEKESAEINHDEKIGHPVSKETKKQAKLRYKKWRNLKKVSDFRKWKDHIRKKFKSSKPNLVVEHINVKELKAQLDSENFNTEVVEEEKDEMDVVRKYSPRVKALLEVAKEKSHQFIQDKLHHTHEDQLSYLSGISLEWICTVGVVVILVLLVGAVIFLPVRRAWRTRKILKGDDTVELLDVGGDVRWSDAGWNRSMYNQNRTMYDQKLK